MSWALMVSASSDIQILGAGLYSWYSDDYSEACVDSQNCQLTLVVSYIYNINENNPPACDFLRANWGLKTTGYPAE
jgi:hypothetical protein